MRKRRLMLLGMAFLSVIMFSPSAAAQSSTVVSADSNLSDTNLTVDFSGLEADTEYSLEALTADGTQSITSFTSSSSGAASVEFRHAPFTRDQSTLSAGSSRGWIYQLSYTENDSQAYTFELVHGNMLTGIDTFNDASVNQDIWNFNNNGDGDCNFAENENTGVYYFEASSSINQDKSCEATSRISYTISDDEVVNFDLEHTGTGDTEGELRMVNNGVLTSVDVTNQAEYKAYIEDGTAYIERGGSVVSSSSVSVTNFNAVLYVDNYDSGFENSRMDVYEFSVTPEVSKNAWSSPTEFNPAESDLIFGDVVLAGSDVGLEYSADGSSWSSTPPSGLHDNLFYRNTGSGTLELTATETGQAFQNLDITPLTPQDNAVYPIPTNDSLPLDFEYSVFYGEDVESSVTWTLENSTEELSSTIYPDLDAPIDRSFTESATVPIGEYNWTVSVEDKSLDASSSETFSFSVIDEENATVSFDLVSPSSGEEVDASDGVDFSYEVQAENSGTLNLWIPEQSMTSPQFSETLGSGTTSRTVNLDVPSGSELSWYLTFEEDSTGDVYTSQSVQFTTAEEGTEPQPDDGEGFSIPSLWFSALESFGFTGDSAEFITAFIVILLASVIGFVLAGTFGGAAGLALALLITAITGLLPSWIVLVVVFLAGGVTAYFIVEAATGGN